MPRSRPTGTAGTTTCICPTRWPVPACWRAGVTSRSGEISESDRGQGRRDPHEALHHGLRARLAGGRGDQEFNAMRGWAEFAPHVRSQTRVVKVVVARLGRLTQPASRIGALMQLPGRRPARPATPARSSRRAVGSQPPVKVPVADRRATPCMPPTFIVQSGPLVSSWPRSRSSPCTSASTRDFEQHGAAVGEPRARRLDRLLQRQAEIDVLHEGLRLGLQDAVAAGRAERQHRLVVLRSRSRARRRSAWRRPASRGSGSSD